MSTDVLNIISLANIGTPEEDAKVARAIREAYTNVGFAYITGYDHFVPQSLVDSVFDYNAKFFDLDAATKESLAYTSSKANRGYLSMGREQASQSKTEEAVASERSQMNDQKESFEIGNDSDPEYPEHWPAEAALPGFKAVMNEFHQRCHQLHLKMMGLLAIGLDLPHDYFVPQIDGRAHNLRLLHYPPTDPKGSSSRLGAHTDFGTVTLLWQDMTGGLQIVGPNGDWVDVEPRPNVFVVNVGDILQHWSNDILKSTIHRAILPNKLDENGKTKTRRSVAYFCNPNADAVIECIPGMGTPKYEPVVAGDFYAEALKLEIGV